MFSWARRCGRGFGYSQSGDMREKRIVSGLVRTKGEKKRRRRGGGMS